jgi:hypothetical protein
MEIDVDFWKEDAIIIGGLRKYLCKAERKFQCNSVRTKVCSGAAQPRLDTPYFASATSGSGIASTGKFMG